MTLKPARIEKNFEPPKITEFNKSDWFSVDRNVDPLEMWLLCFVRTRSVL